MLNSLLSWISHLDWTDALLGFFVGGSATTLRVGWRALANRRPLRRFFDDLADDSQALSIFAREMVSQDGKYYSQLPDGGVEAWQNFPVVGLIDVEAAADALNVLGQAGRTTNIRWRRVTTDSGIWSDPLVCVGGSFKTNQVFALCRPQFVRSIPPDTFVATDGRTFKADQNWDYGLVARLRHPETGVSCVLLVGFGMAGTAAAGSYFRRRAAELAYLYGRRPFAVILRVGWHDGVEAAVPVWMSANKRLHAALIHPRVWWKYRALHP